MFAFHLPRNSCFSLALALAVLAPRVAAQHTWYVDDNGSASGNGSFDNPYPGIQRAIAAWNTQPGDTIIVRPGLYRERVNFTRAVNLVGEGGAAQTIIDAGHRGTAVSVRNQYLVSHLEGFTLRNGSGRFNEAKNEAPGGGINCLNSQLVVVGCTITGNATRVGGLDSKLAGSGGGIWGGTNADIVLIDCTIQDNDAVDGGGVSLERGSLTMNGGTLLGNRALGDDFAPGRGGGVIVKAGAHLALLGVAIERNLALGNLDGVEALGGGIRIEANSTATIDGCSIALNDSGGFSLGYGDLCGYGGGLSSMARAADFTMTSTSIHDNWGNNGGGGVHGKGTLRNCTIEGNHGQFGGGVAAVDMQLFDCVLRGNLGSVSGSYDWGGGIYVGTGRYARLESCELDSNHAFGQGGGGWGGTYVNCDIHDNFAWADESAGFVGGGGVFGGDLTGCRVWNNRSHEIDFHSAEGGGLYGSLATQCIVFGNDADFFGGASSARLERCTVVDNIGTSAGDGVGYSVVHGCIVRFNATEDVIVSTVSWSNVPAGTAGTGNVFADPMFWSVPGRDFRLQPGSPCIDAGDPSSPPDPDGSRADIGAVPFGS